MPMHPLSRLAAVACLFFWLDADPRGSKCFAADDVMAAATATLLDIDSGFGSWDSPHSCLSADGKLLVVAGKFEESAVVVDVADGKLVSRIPFGDWSDWLFPERMSSNGRLLAASSELGLVVIEMSSGKRLHTFPPPNPFSSADDVDFSGDSHAVAYLGNDDQLRVHDTSTGRVLLEHAPDEVVFSLRFIDDETVEYLSESGVWRLDIRSGTRLGQDVAAAPGWSLRRAISGKNFFLIEKRGESRAVGVQDRATGQQLWTRPLLKVDYDCEMSDDGRWVAVKRWHNNEVEIYHAGNGSLAATFRVNGGPLREIRFSANGEILVANTDYRAHVWRLPDGKELDYCDGLEGVSSVAVAPDRSLIAVQDCYNVVWAYDGSNGALRFKLEVGTGVAISGEPACLWRLLENESMCAYSLANGNEMARFRLPTREYASTGVLFWSKDKVTHWRLTPDAHRVAYLFASNGIAFFDLLEGKGEGLALNESGARTRLSLSSDGATAAVSNHEPTSVSIVDFAVGRESRSRRFAVPGEETFSLGAGGWVKDRVVAPIMSDAEHPFAIAVLDGRSARLLDNYDFPINPKWHKQLWSMRLESFLAVSESAQLAAFGGRRGEVRMIDLKRKTTSVFKTPHTTFVAAVAFSKDGQEFVSVGIDGRIVVSSTNRD